MLGCTAKVTGHHTSQRAAATCPVHGPGPTDGTAVADRYSDSAPRDDPGFEPQHTTVKGFLAAANGKKVIRTAEGIHTVEDWESRKAAILDDLQLQGAPDDYVTETENGDLRLGNGQTIFKPRMMKHTEGTLQVRSRDTVFTPEGSTRGSHGDITGAKMVGGRFVQSYKDGPTISYEIVGPDIDDDTGLPV